MSRILVVGGGRDRRHHRRAAGRRRRRARRQRGARRRAARPRPRLRAGGRRAHRACWTPSTSVDELEGEFDFALVAVKSPLHHVALEPLVARGGIGAFVSMGNGLIQDRMEGIVGAGQPARVHRRVGRLQRRAGAARARLARRLHGRRARRRRCASARASWRALLEPVGHTRVTDNVRGMIWSKLLINTTFTGLSAVSGLRYGGVAEQGPDAVFALWAEGVAVGDAQGLTLESIHETDPHEFDEAELARMMESMANVRPSMLQDLDAGRDDRGRRRQRRRRASAGASSASRRRATTPWSSSCTRWSAASASPEPRWLALRQRRADHQRDRHLNPGAGPGRGVQLRARSSARRACPGSAGRGRRSRRPARARRRGRRPRRRRARPSPRR